MSANAILPIGTRINFDGYIATVIRNDGVYAMKECGTEYLMGFGEFDTIVSAGEATYEEGSPLPLTPVVERVAQPVYPAHLLD